MGETATILEHRPVGRERLLLATEAALRAGHEVRIAEVCKEADVSAALIYKYFVDRDDLVAEGYARLFKGLVARDLIELSYFPTDLEELRVAVRRQAREIFSAERDEIRWARLEALSHARMNPGVAARIEAVRCELVQSLADVMMGFEGVTMTRGQAEAFSVICLGMVLGVTAMSPQEMTDQYRDELAETWASMVYGKLSASRNQDMHA